MYSPISIGVSICILVIDKYSPDLVMSYEMHIVCPVCGNLSVGVQKLAVKRPWRNERGKQNMGAVLR